MFRQLTCDCGVSGVLFGCPTATAGARLSYRAKHRSGAAGRACALNVGTVDRGGCGDSGPGAVEWTEGAVESCGDSVMPITEPLIGLKNSAVSHLNVAALTCGGHELGGKQASEPFSSLVGRGLVHVVRPGAGGLRRDLSSSGEVCGVSEEVRPWGRRDAEYRARGVL
jgi:hypothetical protein